MSEDEGGYTIGIDLGTTHCAVASVDKDLSEGEEVAQEVLPIPQVVSAGEISARPLLGSFLYIPHSNESAPGQWALPWQPEPHRVAGDFARQLGSQVPTHLVASAKSWLCHPGVDRRAPLLPIDADAKVNKVSPLEASRHYLEHLRHAWNQAHPEAPLHQQRVVVTVPASFDPAARELTAEAARQAELGELTLLEEPQAALYHWIASTAGGWRERLKVDDIILVVDVGGGTTDFSLITVQEDQGTLSLQRIAVGSHILLGGDNMDLALAHRVRQKLEQQTGSQLDAWQLRALAHGCRTAKEQLLQGEARDAVPVVVPSRGSRLVGGSLRSELTQQEVADVVLEGFFPSVEVTARPTSRPRAAVAQLGLPYAQDAAITRHLAKFLGRQEGAAGASTGGSFIRPTAMLFNGGVFKSPELTGRLTEVLNGWLSAEGAPPVRVLDSPDLDVAVAKGAAYYAHAQQGRGVRIRGGTANAYYIGVESSMPAVPGMEPPLQALCVAPFGMEEGSQASALEQPLGLVVGESVQFRFFGSPVRRDDAVGTVLERWTEEQLHELPPITATLPAEDRAAGELVPVHLQAAITEVGTLQLRAIPTGQAEHPGWKVELNVRQDAP